MKKLFLIPVAAALFTACSNETEPEPAVNDGPVALQVYVNNIAVNAQIATRAANSAWEDNDAIGIYATTTTTDPWNNIVALQCHGENTSYTFNDATYETSGSTYLSFGPTDAPVYLPANGSAIHVYAYYPYTSPLSATDAKTVTLNVGTQNSQKAIDFMTTGPVSTTTHLGSTLITKENPSCQLLFSHRLVKLQFNLKHGNGMAETDINKAGGNTVALSIPEGLYTTASYNIFTDGISNFSANNVDITPVEMASPGVWASGSPDVMADRSFEAIILPQTLNADKSVQLTISNPQSSAAYTFNIPATTFMAGNKYIYNITVNAMGLTVTAAITPWTSQDPSYLMNDGSTLYDLKSLINSTNLTSLRANYYGKYVLADGTISSTSGSAIGQIAYIANEDVDAGKTGSKILVVATADAGSSYAWKSSTVADDDAYTSTTAWNGLTFTNAYKAATEPSYAAAAAAAGYNARRPSGASIWFLPSYKQMDMIKSYITTDGDYWTSTEVDGTSTNAHFMTVSGTGTSQTMDNDGAEKTETKNVRAIFAY